MYETKKLISLNNSNLNKNMTRLLELYIKLKFGAGGGSLRLPNVHMKAFDKKIKNKIGFKYIILCKR